MEITPFWMEEVGTNVGQSIRKLIIWFDNEYPECIKKIVIFYKTLRIVLQHQN